MRGTALASTDAQALYGRRRERDSRKINATLTITERARRIVRVMKQPAIHERALKAATKLEKDIDGSLTVSGQRFASAAAAAVRALFPDDDIAAVERITSDRPAVGRYDGPTETPFVTEKAERLTELLLAQSVRHERKNDGTVVDGKYRSWILIPVSTRKETRIAILVARKAGRFDEDDLQAANSFQAFLSQALKNARSRNKKVAHADEDARHRVLLAAQWSIARRRADFPGFHKAVDLAAGTGSDVCLAHRSADGRTLMCVADVTANDPERLSGLVYLDAWFSILARTTLDACGMIQRLNADLIARGAECYVSMALARYIPAQSTVEIAGCGNACAAVLCHDSMETKIIEFGPAAGIAADTTIESRKIAVKPGDIVCAFTDGLHSTRKKTGELYGLSDIGEIIRKNCYLSAEALAERILKTVADSGERDVNADDRAIQVLKIE